MEAAAHAEVLSPFPHPEMPPGSPCIYASLIAGTGPRRSIGGKEAYRVIRKIFTHLSWAVWSPPPYHAVHTLTATLHAMDWQETELGPKLC